MGTETNAVQANVTKMLWWRCASVPQLIPCYHILPLGNMDPIWCECTVTPLAIFMLWLEWACHKWVSEKHLLQWYRESPGTQSGILYVAQVSISTSTSTGIQDGPSVAAFAELDIKHFVCMPIGHVVLKIYVPCENFHVPSQYVYKPCKAYVYCWEIKFMPRLKNHLPRLPSQACDHKSLCALGQDYMPRACRHALMLSPALA